MLEAKMRDALNKQINAELYSSYLYLSMAAWFESLSLKGFAHWMHVQATEEHAHGMKLFAYVIERGGKIELKAIEAPPKSWKNPLDAFKAVAAHEAKVTGLINALADQAQGLRDHATSTMLHWFISEQVEEEANAAEIVAKLEMIGESSGGLFALDHQLAKRGE